MRGTRWLLLVAIAAIVYGIGFSYRNRKKDLRDTAIATPAALPGELSSTAANWQHHVTDHGRPIADIEAEDFRQVKDSSYIDLKNVSMRLRAKDGVSYNLVKSAAARFYTNDERLYSDGAVEMTLKVPLEGKPRHKLVSIKSSGVTFDTTTGKAETDRPSSFVFENGYGSATGAFYDPNTHQLLMKSDVEFNYKPVGPHSKLMLIEAGSLEYRESENQILLKPWGRMTRENTVVEGDNPVIHLRDDGFGNKILRNIETTKAHGTDNYPNRKLQYAADHLWMSFDEDGQVQRITGQDNANLTNTAQA
jgi:lipopolysaccharide export system protein LptA